MSSETDEILKSIDRRLKSLLRLQVTEAFDEEATNKEKVKTLTSLGFETGEMAEIIGTTRSSIRGTQSTLRSEGEID